MAARNQVRHHATLEACKAWKRIKASGRKPTWSHWTISIGPGLAEARAEAMGITGSNRPIGRAYNVAMSELLKKYGLDDVHETRRGHVLKNVPAT
jgi:hypothetical protein